MKNKVNDNWLKENTFHHSRFKDLNELVERKEKKNLKISLCFPTLNEEKTVAKEIVVMKSELMIRRPLLDEIVVIDSGSTDHTREIAASYGVDVHLAHEILPDLGKVRGKGENLWKALYITKGDIVVYIDSDINNIHHRFCYGLLGPLLFSDRIKFSKAFYDRPIFETGGTLRATGGGRVTELVVRPLFSLFFPELTQLSQPLSGEYAGYREILEKIPFPVGYGVETGMLLDIYQRWGLDVMAQVDLDRRVHKNQETKALGVMSFAIVKTFLSRLEKLGRIDIKHPLFDEMIQHKLVDDEPSPDIFKIKGMERPPMVEIPEYQERMGQLRASEGSSPKN
jgi:glucosyl-3-phosphoglycerate synthase